MATEGGETRKPRRRWVLWVLVVAGLALLVLVGLAAGAALWVLYHLDSPWVRARALEAIREATGVEVDYDEVDLSLTRGISLRGLRVLTPQPYRPRAPVLAGVDHVEVSWDLALFGPFRIERVAMSGVRLTLVQDEAGSSLDALLDAMPKPEREPPPTRLSQGLPIRGLNLVIEDLLVTDVVVARLHLRGGEVVRTETLQGLALQGALRSEPGTATASLTVKSPDGEPTQIEVREMDGAGAMVRHEVAIRHAIRLVVDDPLHARFDVEIHQVTQDFRPDFPWTGPLLQAGLAVSFHPEESRIAIEVTHATIAQGVAEASFQADYWDAPHDQTLARVSKARVSCDLDRLPEAVRALVPQVRWKGGTVDLVAEAVEVLRGSPWLRVRGRVSGRVAASEFSAVAAERRAEVRELEVLLGAVETPSGSLRADASLGSRLLRVREPQRLLTLRDASLSLGVGIPDLSQALAGALTGEATLKAGARMASVRTASGRIRLADFEASVSAPLSTAPPFQAQGEARMAGVTWTPSAGEPRPLPGGRIAWTIEDVVLDLDRPQRTLGRLSLKAGVGDLSAEARLTKAADHAEFALSLAARSLSLLAPFADQPGLRDLRIPFGRVGVAMKTEGRVTGLAARPALDQKVSLTMTGFQGQVGGHRLEVPSLQTDLALKGTMADLRVTGSLAAAGSRVDGRVPLRQVAMTLDARVTPSASQGQMSLRVAGRRGPMLEASLDARIAGSERVLAWSGSLKAEDLAEAAPLLPSGLRFALDLASLRAKVETSGQVAGVFGRGWRLVPRLMDTARGQASFRASLRGLAYRTEGLEVEAPEVEVGVEAARLEGPATLSAFVRYPSLSVDQRVRRFEVTGGAHQVRVETDGDPAAGEVRVDLAGTIARLAHDASARYPVENASVQARVRVSRLDAMRVDDLVLENPSGGTRLRASLALDDLGGRLPQGLHAAWDLVLGRRSLTVTGTLEQRLDPLSHESFATSGAVRVLFRVQSGDRSLFRVAASIEAQKVRLEVPQARIAVRGLNGTIPIEEEVAVGRDGRPSLILESDHNLFSRVRFQDQHPFLTGGGFVAADGLVLGPLEVGPVAANLRILRNLVSLDQMEAVWREGKVTGQVVVEWHPGDPHVAFRGKVTGIRPSGSDERLDANAALDLHLGRREVEGRVHFVRIGRRHLLDLLDAFDPYRENVSANRIRKALQYGYPKYARVRVNGGFLSAKVELGGLGAVVRIDEVRGIPTGPLWTRALGTAAR